VLSEVISFIVAILATTAALVFGLATAGNQYRDISRAYTTVGAILFGGVALLAWIGFMALRRRHDFWDEEHD
jgi:threonine/homoserine/homoserine lactone efflux protein